MIKTKKTDLNYNYIKMNELIKEQLELFESKGSITEKNKTIFYKLEKEMDTLEKKLTKQLNALKAAKHKESGKIYRAFNCRYSISAIQVEGHKMSWEKFFNDYIAL